MNKKLNNTISRIKGIIPQSLFLIATYGIFMPCSLFLGNINEFAVEFHAILPIVLTISFMMLLLLVLLACVCINKNIYRIVSGLIFSVAVGFYLQGNFLNPKLNTLNGEPIDWSQYTKNGVISIIAWCACILLPQILLIKRHEVTRQVIKWGSYFFAAVQISSLLVLILTTSRTINNDLIVTKEEQFELGQQENIVVFVLDTFEASYFKDIFLDDEYYLEELKDFTFFDNVVAGGAPTVLGIPSLLTGELYDARGDWEDYYIDAYGKSELFDDLHKNDYKVQIYTSFSYLNGIEAGDVDNVKSGHIYRVSSYKEFGNYLYKLVSFYAMPQFMKQQFWFYGDDLSGLVTVEDSGLEIYQEDDVAFYKELINTQVKLGDGEKTFVMYHLFGAHGPHTMNEECERVDEGESSLVKQMKGCMKIVLEYISQMKELGVYANSTIVITADHGATSIYQNPMVMIKEKNVSKDLSTDSRLLTFKNLRATIADAFLEDASAYGNTVFDADVQNKNRLHTAPKVLGEAIFPDNPIACERSWAQYIIPQNILEVEAIRVIDSDNENAFVYNMGEVIDLSTDTGELARFKVGIEKEATKEGKWLQASSVKTLFLLEKYQGNDVALNIVYSKAVDEHQVMEIWAGDLLIDSIKCNEEGGEITVHISKENIENDVLELEFRMPNAKEENIKTTSIQVKSLTINELT